MNGYQHNKKKNLKNIYDYNRLYSPYLLHVK